MKRISAIVFVIFIIGLSIFLLNIYRQAAPPKFFFLFIAFVGGFIVIEIMIYKFIRKRFADNPLVIKLFDLFSFIVLGLLLYLFALYIFPG
jgi:uncharacterized membrane-anchored protein